MNVYIPSFEIVIIDILCVLFDFTKTNMGIEVSWKYFANTHDS